MAKDVSTNPWKFDAADQYEGFANRNETTAPNFEVKPYVDTIVFEASASGGNFDVRVSNGGDPVSGIITLGANEQFQLVVGQRLEGVYIETMTDASGQILVYHGQNG